MLLLMPPRAAVSAALLSLTLLAACSEPAGERDAAPEATPTALADNEVSIRWTKHGIPHVRANNWEGLGYGFANAVANNTLCVLAREFVTVRGEQAKYFGASDESINADAFHRALLNGDKIDEYLAYGSADSRAMDAGYVRGYNDYIEAHAGQMPASCNNAPWITPIDERDLARMAIGVGIRYGLGNVTDEIATAQQGLELAQLAPLNMEIDREEIGSNALGFGSAMTESGRGILLGNPHYPWHGPSRFHMAHLTLPGELDVMGVGLITTSRIAIGFTEHVAWSHTVSTALRFTMFRLDLVDGNPMAYRLGDEERAIEPIEVVVETPDGPAARTVYMTHLGPVVAGQGMPWNDQHVFVMRDVNYENYRSGDQYKAINSARNVHELRDALAAHQGAAFVNTIAADRDGGALYADMSAIPNVSAALIERCAADTPVPRIITLNGSDPSCDWQVDPTAAWPGLMPPDQQPSLITETYVSNSNDSYWLSNPDELLEGFSPIIGDERTPRSLRTRAGLVMVEEILESDEKFTRERVQGLLFNHRHYGAELLLDDILTVCADVPELLEACTILDNWDRRQDVGSVGAQIYNQFWANARGISDHYAIPFKETDPLHTPAGLTIWEEDTQRFIINALTAGVQELEQAGIPLDAPWGEVQFALRNGDMIGIPGGNGGQGMFSVISAPFNPDNGGYNPIVHGNSYIQAVTWHEDGTPDAEAILTYSQSPEPDSPYYADQTRLYEQSEWVELPFTDAEIAEQLLREEVLSY
ncbi:MAG: penicillin acylase family protein [Pseudohongiellaceae bacterium]